MADRKAYMRVWRKTHKEQRTASSRKYNLAHPERRRQSNREYYIKNLDRCRQKWKAYRLANPEKCRKAIERWKRKYPERFLNHRRKTYRRLSRSINFRISQSLRSRLAVFVRCDKKFTSAVRMLGCPVADFKIYLESRFEPGMTWDNYGKLRGCWHIDHIMPCAIFDLTKPEHQKRCFHFSNLQPMWAHENWSKGRKISDNQFNLI